MQIGKVSKRVISYYLTFSILLFRRQAINTVDDGDEDGEEIFDIRLSLTEEGAKACVYDVEVETAYDK